MSAAGDINKWLSAAKRAAKAVKRERNKRSDSAGTERRDNEAKPTGSFRPTITYTRKDYMDDNT